MWKDCISSYVLGNRKKTDTIEYQINKTIIDNVLMVNTAGINKISTYDSNHPDYPVRSSEVHIGYICLP